MIIADEGMVLTNGEIYGTTIFLSIGENEADYWEISREKYEEKLKSEDDNHEIM